MAKITIELDTCNDEDAALAAKLFAGAPPTAADTYAPVPMGPEFGTPFPTIQPSVEMPDPARRTTFGPGELQQASLAGTVAAAPTVVESSEFTAAVLSPRITPLDEAYEIGVSTLASAGVRASHGSPTPPAELDAAGLPWDARIHSESRARIADGTWRRKRGVDQALVDSVTAELRGTAVPQLNEFGAPAACTPIPAPVAAEVPPPPAAPVIAPPPPVVTPAAPAARGVPDLAAAVARGTLSLADLNAACLLHGCANVLELNKNPAALTAVCAQFDAIGAFQ